MKKALLLALSLGAALLAVQLLLGQMQATATEPLQPQNGTALLPTPHPVEFIPNGGFEQNDGYTPDGWKRVSDWPLVTREYTHTGKWGVCLGGKQVSPITETLYTTVTLPAGAMTPTLSVWWWITSHETILTDDLMTLALVHPVSGVLTSLLTLNAGDVHTAWTESRFALDDYRGLTFRVVFTGVNGVSTPTTFCLDDVSLKGYLLYAVYIPLAMRGWPPIQPPTLYTIENADLDGTYTVTWSAVPSALTYTLQESNIPIFEPPYATPTVVYAGPLTWWMTTAHQAGYFYYRVRAEGSGWATDWSNVEEVHIVTPVITIASP